MADQPAASANGGGQAISGKVAGSQPGSGRPASAPSPAVRPLDFVALGLAPLWLLAAPFVWGLSGGDGRSWWVPPLALLLPGHVSVLAFGWALGRLARTSGRREMAWSLVAALVLHLPAAVDLLWGPLRLE